MHLRRFAGVAAGLTLLLTLGVACGKDVVSADEGDCIEAESLAGSVSELPTVDCDEDHAAQVVGSFDHDGDDFPGAAAIQEEANDECQDLFEDFVGAPVEETSLQLVNLNPTEESWNEADDRETICLTSRADGDDLDQSVEDAADDFEATDGGGVADDTSLDDFADDVEGCEDGDMVVCDTLYSETPVGSEAEAVALTCGGEDPGGDHRGDCEDAFG
jgi:Septum formation